MQWDPILHSYTLKTQTHHYANNKMKNCKMDDFVWGFIASFVDGAENG